MARNKRQRRAKRSGLAVVLVFLLVVAIAVGGIGVFLHVTEIVVEGQSDKYTNEDIAAASGVELGDSLMFMSTSKAEESILSQLPYLAIAEVSRSFPGTVVISVSDSVPAARLSCDGKVFIIDSSTRVLDIISPTENVACPTVTGFTTLKGDIARSLEAEDSEETKLSFLKDILAALVDEGITGNIRSIDLSNISRISMIYDGRITVILGSGENIPEKMQKFFGILAQQSENAAGTIDVSPDDRGYFIAE